MTDYKKYINALRKCAKENENDRTFTGYIIVADLCRDTANLLEELEQQDDCQQKEPILTPEERSEVLNAIEFALPTYQVDGYEDNDGVFFKVLISKAAESSCSEKRNESDIISRRDAIEECKLEFLNPNVERETEELTLIDQSFAKGWNNANSIWIKALEQLPSAEPKTAESGSVEKEMPEIKSDRTIDDLISRQAAIVECNKRGAEHVGYAIAHLPSAHPKWNNHTVACLLAELFDDTCACNYNGIDEWLPGKCELLDSCPNPVGVACWEQYLKHRAERRIEKEI